MNRSHTRFVTNDGIAVLTLARSETRNAITGEKMLAEMIGAIDEASADSKVAVLIIEAEGPAFSAGGNVKDMAERRGLFAGTPEEINEGYRISIQRLTSAVLTTDVVTIAAVNGPAVGAGFDLVLGCDLRVGSTAARFTHTFIDLGIIPGDGGAWLLPRVVGWQRAADLSFTGRTVGAEEAVDLGILLEVVEPERLTTVVFELAAQIAAKPTHSVRLTKRLLRHSRQMDLAGFLDLSAAYQAISHHTQAHSTAVDNFVDRLGRKGAGGHAVAQVEAPDE
ncbi:MAG TPA: enoyl-CoA hydratase-related protein [Acidimicrobiia bacterium]|nr:enoyl-CoA hydratase-related protein [Acidimicrobiia bacterium]